ncbi:oligosaccharide flippase family protein [uncultured Alistipes sp.]|uniref:oligosaccharide flippase family protein n=1 Tax=uncultured Alistipes sp. TaxID=538949 RepID=UPI0026210696|nr:oligosaccharide flippase family protein [uncultured Alistipes sp.]
MTQPSIKENFAYKSVLTLSTYLIAFVTFPYVSRVLGVERVGLVNFADNTIGYFLLFATMGVNILGVREIAAVKEDPERRARVFSNILGLNLMFTAVTLAVFLALVAAVPKLHQHAGLFYIGTAKILFSAFLVEWFFTGIEQFRYITLRSIAVKVLYVASVFLFVRRPEDYRLYFILTVGVVVVNALVNTAYVRRYVRIRRRDLSGTNYVRRNLLLGVYSIMSAMYLTFNVMFLGFVADDTQVGYYTTAFKLYTVILGFFTAFTNVMLPRMSTLLAGGEQERFHALIDRSFRAMCLFSIPMIVCSIILAPQIIHLLAGPGYEGAILPMRLIMPAVLPVGIAQVLAIQVLMPMKRDRALLTASILGAAVSLAINIALVPRMQSIGTALVLLGAETTVTTAYVTYTLRHGLTRLPFDAIGRNLLISLAPAAVCLACARGIAHPLLALGTALPCSVLVWAAICYRTGQLSGLLRFGKTK